MLSSSQGVYKARLVYSTSHLSDAQGTKLTGHPISRACIKIQNWHALKFKSVVLDPKVN